MNDRTMKTKKIAILHAFIAFSGTLL